MDSSNDRLQGKALGDLLVAEQKTMRKFSYSLTGSMDDANEIVQSAMERCLRSGVPREGSRAWLFKVCKNLWIDEIRRRGRKPQDEFDESRDTETSDTFELNTTEADIARRSQLQKIAIAMRQLSDEHRVILSMAAIEGMQYAEIADALEIPMGTVMSRLARARLALNQHINEAQDGQ